MRTRCAQWLVVGVTLGVSGCLAFPRRVPGLYEEKLGALPALLGDPVYGPNGWHIGMVVAGNGGGQRVWIDGNKGPEYDTVLAPVFGPSGKHVAYVAKRGKKWLVVMDGKEGPEYDGIGEGGPVFSPSGDHLAYVAKKGDKALIVKDGRPGPKYDGIEGPAPGFFFTNDFERLAYDAIEGSRHIRVLGGQRAPDYGYHDAAVPFIQEGWRGARMSSKDAKALLLGDGTEIDDNAGPVSSEDGKHTAWLVKRGDRWLVSVDGAESPKYDWIVGPSYREDGTLEFVAYRDGALYRVTVQPPLPEGLSGISVLSGAQPHANHR